MSYDIHNYIHNCRTFGPGIKLTYMYDVYKLLDSFALADADRSGMQGDRRRASYWLVRSMHVWTPAESLEFVC